MEEILTENDDTYSDREITSINSNSANKDNLILVIFVLACASFLAMVTENLPIGLLLDMQAGLQTSASAIGFTVTGYAFVVAVTAAPLMKYVQRFDRKHTLLATFIIYGLSCIITALSINYPMLLVSRFLGGIAHGVFWALIAVYSAAISVPEKQARNLSVILAGSSMGLALGVPAATWLGQHTSWRVSFGLIGILLLALTAIAVMIMHSSQPERTSKFDAEHVNLWKIRGFIPMLGTVCFVMLGQFTIYTYIQVFFQQRNVPSSKTTILLFVMGFAGIVGLWVGTLFNRVPIIKRTQVLVWLFLVVVSCVYFSPHIAAVFIIAILLWGFTYAILPSYLQPLAVGIGGRRAEIVSGLYVATYNFGIGGGALLGGQLHDAAVRAHGNNQSIIDWLFIPALSLILIGALCSLGLSRKRTNSGLSM